MFLLVRLFIFLFHFLFSNIDWSCVAFVDLSCTFLVELPDARESRNDFVACFTPSTCNRGAFVCFRWCSTDDVFHIHLFCPPTADAFLKSEFFFFFLSLSLSLSHFMIIISSTESRIPPPPYSFPLSNQKWKTGGLPHFHVMSTEWPHWTLAHCSM